MADKTSFHSRDAQESWEDYDHLSDDTKSESHESDSSGSSSESDGEHVAQILIPILLVSSIILLVILIVLIRMLLKSRSERKVRNSSAAVVPPTAVQYIAQPDIYNGNPNYVLPPKYSADASRDEASMAAGHSEMPNEPPPLYSSQWDLKAASHDNAHNQSVDEVKSHVQLEA